MTNDIAPVLVSADESGIPTGEMELPAPTIRITAKGLAELHKRLGGTAVLAPMAVTA